MCGGATWLDGAGALPGKRGCDTLSMDGRGTVTDGGVIRKGAGEGAEATLALGAGGLARGPSDAIAAAAVSDIIDSRNESVSIAEAAMMSMSIAFDEICSEGGSS